MNTTRFAMPAALLAATLTLAGCGGAAQGQSQSSSPAGAAAMEHGGHSMPMGTAPATSSQGAYNAADAMFAQMMIPHHQQAVEMSDLVLAKAGLDARVSALAQQIKAAQAPEIATLKGWLSAWGQPTTMPSTGHAMDGMMSDGDLATLTAADGAAASRLFLTQMIAHHEGAVAMARTELGDGANPEAVAMARSIVDSQSKEIEAMKALIAQL